MKITNKYLLKFFLFSIISFLIIPQIIFAAWWNPFTWKVFNRAKAPQTEVQRIVQPSEIEKLRDEINNLKKEANTSVAVSPKSSTPPSGIIKSVTEPTVSITKLSNSQIIAKIKPAVVYIETKSGVGSGMIFSTDGYVLTNGHVVKGYTYVDVSISSGETLSGKVVGRDEEADLAVIKITSDKTFIKVNFGDSSKTEQGEEVFALGFPFGIRGDVSFKEGTISRRIENYFETSAEIHPGNSGGPLVNRYGQVIGINTAIYGKSVAGLQFGETIKLAIPINIAKNLITDLKAGRNIIVESQEEKQVKQETKNKSACLAESEQYYSNLVNGINQLNNNDLDFQKLILQIDQQITNIKNSGDSQVDSITSRYDEYITQIRQTYGKQIQANEMIAMRYGGDMASQIASIQAQMDEKVASYESQKQSQIALVQSSTNLSIANYEVLKAKGKSDKDKSTQNSLANAKVKKAEYYNECINK